MLGLIAHFARTFNPLSGLAWLAWFLALAVPDACAEGPPISFVLSLAVGRSPIAVVVTDFNRDGRADIAVANSESDSLSVLFGSGAGSFLPAVRVLTAAGPNALGAADLDRDLLPDLVVSNGVDDVIQSFVTRPASRFEKTFEMPSGTGPSGLTTPDLDRDGVPDLVITNSFDGTISVFLGESSGTYQALGDLITGSGIDSGPLGVATGDFDRDGQADVVVANQLEDSVTVFFGDGTGAFPEVRTFEVDALPTAARFGDVTGDSLADIVVVNEGSDTVVILMGDGMGEVVDRRTLDTGGFPESVALRDLNGDGLADVITADSFSDVISVFASNGDGEFQDRVVFPVGRSPFDIGVGDFNADGRPDLVTANLDDDTVSILLNTTPYTPAHGDADGDALVDGADLEALLRELFDGDGDLAASVDRGSYRSAPSADGNLDGFITAADLLAVSLTSGRSRPPFAPARLTSVAVEF